jgi:hypothetical protein
MNKFAMEKLESAKDLPAFWLAENISDEQTLPNFGCLISV